MKLKQKIMEFLIRLFGNIQLFRFPAFVILWGDIHYKVKGPEMRRVTEMLRTGDIVLRRYNSYVSGMIIPGFWSHAGVAGADKVIHAMEDGVIEEDILTFLRTDYVAILRPKISNDKKKEAYHKACEMIGKEYDFIFDTKDDRRMYCTELVLKCFDGSLDLPNKDALSPSILMEIDNLEVIHDSRQWREKENNHGTK